MKGRLAGMRILVVEDENPLVDELARALGDLGADVETAAREAEAFDAFIERRPTVVLIDLGLRAGGGLVLLRRIRALSPEAGGRAPAVAMSAGSRADEAFDAGFDDFIKKPFSRGRLVEAITRVAGAVHFQ